MIVAGSMIGSGIFIVSADISGMLEVQDGLFCLADHRFYDSHRSSELRRTQWDVSQGRWPVCLSEGSLIILWLVSYMDGVFFSNSDWNDRGSRCGIFKICGLPVSCT